MLAIADSLVVGEGERFGPLIILCVQYGVWCLKLLIVWETYKASLGEMRIIDSQAAMAGHLLFLLWQLRG